MNTRSKRSITLMAAFAAIFCAFGITAYAETITYIRMDMQYPIYVDQVHPEEIEFDQFGNQEYTTEFVFDMDVASYEQGDSVPITLILTASEGYDFKDIKLASIKISGQCPDAFELSEGDTVLTLHYTFPALTVVLEQPEGLWMTKNGKIGWEEVPNADYYTVEVERMNDYGERVYIHSYDFRSNMANIKNVIYQDPGDYLYSVFAKSERYFRRDSECASLPLSDSVIISQEDIGYKSNIIDGNGKIYMDGHYVHDMELKIAGEYYYYGSNAEMFGGWRKVKTDYFYYDPVTFARSAGLKEIGTDRYFFDEESGRMLTGFQLVDGKEMFFGGDGKAKTGWVSYKGDIYYIKKDGSRNLEQLQDFRGVSYLFDKEGRLVR